MAKIVVKAGQCGATIEATAESDDDRHVTIKIGQCCEYVENMKAELEAGPLDAYKLMTSIEGSLIYKSANKHLPHVTCPVPSGLHKLVELATGMGVASDVTIKIEK